MEQEQATTEYALSLIAAGDGAGCDLLYGQLGGAMLAAARAVTGDRAAAEDAVQDAFIRIVRGIRGYRPGTNPRAWVLRIVRNCAFDLLRRRRVRAEEDIDAFFHLTDGRYDAGRIERAVLLEDAVGRLSAQERRMIYYRYYLDFTVRETAKETGMSKSAVQRLTVSAENKLRKMLSEGQNEG